MEKTEPEYKNVLLEIDRMISEHSVDELCQGLLFEAFGELSDRLDEYDIEMHPIEGAVSVEIELENDVYVKCVIRARKEGKSFNRFVNDLLEREVKKSEIENESQRTTE